MVVLLKNVICSIGILNHYGKGCRSLPSFLQDCSKTLKAVCSVCLKIILGIYSSGTSSHRGKGWWNDGRSQGNRNWSWTTGIREHLLVLILKRRGRRFRRGGMNYNWLQRPSRKRSWLSASNPTTSTVQLFYIMYVLGNVMCRSVL